MLFNFLKVLVIYCVNDIVLTDSDTDIFKKCMRKKEREFCLGEKYKLLLKIWKGDSINYPGYLIVNLINTEIHCRIKSVYILYSDNLRMGLRRYVVLGRDYALVSTGSEKLWIPSKLIKIRWNQAKSPENLVCWHG